MQAMRPSVAAIICAAGSSSRMNGTKKELLTVPLRLPGESLADPDAKGLTVLGAALSAFASCPEIGPVVIAVPPGGETAARASLPPELTSEKDRVFFVSGGPTRRASVHNGLVFLESFLPSHVLVHDGARPWITKPLIEKIMDAAILHGAAIPVLPLVETPKELDCAWPDCSGKSIPQELRFIERHLRRETLCTAQTPQGFRFPEFLQAHEKAAEKETKEHFEYTDDAEVWGEFIGPVAVVPGDPANRKITYPEDLNAE